MRMEELANNNFIKGTDSVERYLLDIIKQYFSSNNIDDDSREYIIKKAVERMKSELNIDNAGVVSVNGKTGDVTITLDSLGGEPLISPKLSAFNVNFGTEENTACEGNDPRLSDNRHPLQHIHEISEINGLGGELSSINNNINFELPTPSGQLHLVPIQGEDFKKARQNGAFKDVDYLKSNFTGYEMKLDIKTKYPRSIPVHLDSKLKNKIVEQTNKGIQYA